MRLETAGGPESQAAERPPYRWYHKLSSLLFAIFCFEMGVFLLVFPWMDAWHTNYFAWLSPETFSGAAFGEWWRTVWVSPHFRGAVSGLGVVNIYISLLEVFRLRRFSSGQG